MTINLGSIISLKYELENKFKQRVYEQRSQAEEKAKILTSLAFAELGSFFDKMHQFTLESELGNIESDRTSVKSFVSKQFAMAAIKCSEIMVEIQAKKQAKLNEYYTKKDEIEGKIAELKSKISQRETTLSNLESKITNIETSVDTADTTTINQLDDEIKTVQANLEQTHTESVEDLLKQKEVSTDIKVAASEVVKEETAKVSAAVKETNNQGTQPVDTQTKQLVFEFAKESKKVIKETSTTANVDDEKLNEIKTVEKAPVQLEFDFMKDDETKPAETTPAAEKPATTSNNSLLTDNTDTKETNDKSEVAVSQLAKEVGIDEKQVDQAVIADEKTETTPDVANNTTVNKPETPVEGPPTQQEIGKKNIEESVEKVKTVNEATSDLSKNVDEKIANVQNDLTEVHSQLTDNKEEINKEGSKITDITNPITENDTETTETKKAKIKEHTKNLKDVAKKQKEIIEVQKETMKSLEESAQKLIASGTLENLSDLDEKAKQEQEQQLRQLQETLEYSYYELDDLMESIGKNLKDKKEFKLNDDNSFLAKIDNIKKQSENKTEEISNLKKDSVKKDEKLFEKKNKIFFISNDMKSTDKIIENCKVIAENSNKIVVDKELTGLYEQLSNILGNEKVVLDRRNDDRRSQGDRRNNQTQKSAFGLTEDQRKNIEKLSANTERTSSDRRDSSDRRQFNPNNINNTDDFNYFLKQNNNQTPNSFNGY